LENEKPGKVFEARVLGALRHQHRCEVFTSETLDVVHKIDGEIRRIGGTRLKMPVQIQITRRIDHFRKLQAYLNTRWLNADIVSLYVEVHDGLSARETAEHIAWAAREVQTLPPFGKKGPIFGLRIDDDAAFFDPQARLRELQAERDSPERLAALKTGMVYRYEERGFWIMEDERQSLYLAHDIDASNRELRDRLRGKELHVPVRFLPTGKNRATDVRPHEPSRQRRDRPLP